MLIIFFKIHVLPVIVFQAHVAHSVAYITWEQEVAGWIPSKADLFSRTDDSHCNSNHSSVTANYYFDNCYVGKEPVAWKQHYTEYLKKETPGKQ